MSPRLRSNWRRPASNSEGAAPSAEAQTAEVPINPEVNELVPAQIVEGTPSADLSGAAAEPDAAATETRPRTRRAPARPRGGRRATEADQAEAPVAAAPSAEVAADETPHPARRRSPRSRLATATAPVAQASEAPEYEAQVEQAATTESVAQAGFAPAAESLETENAEVADANVVMEPGVDVSNAFAPADTARTLLRRVLPMRRRGGGGGPTSEPGSIDEPPAPYGAQTPRYPAQIHDYEPMPPPTKRKAPRVGTTGPRAGTGGPSENAVDWALGRSSATPEDVGAPEELQPGGARRRRSRRGRRGRGGGDAFAGEEITQAIGTTAGAPAEDRFQRQPRPQEGQHSVAFREERGRSQLSTLEGLIARQNVVLDSLLAKVSSFSNIEHALLAIERRLSTQTGGATGIAAPRVGIFVDVPNIIYAADRVGVTIDFGKLLHYLSRGRELVRASAYAPISDDPLARLDSQKFVQPFVHRGYRIMTKPLKRFSDGTMKGNFDVELAMDVLTMSDRLDVISLVSGDGDFSRLVEIVGSKGVRVEVVAFGASTSSELRAICDDYIDLQDHLDQLV